MGWFPGGIQKEKMARPFISVTVRGAALTPAEKITPQAKASKTQWPNFLSDILETLANPT
jgi:hypothetical protein